MTQDAAVRWSSRKFWTMTVWQAAFTGLLVGGFLTDAIYAGLSAWNLGAYMASNVVQHMKGK